MRRQAVICVCTVLGAGGSAVAELPAHSVVLSSGGIHLGSGSLIVIGQPIIGRAGAPAVTADFGFVPASDPYCLSDYNQDGLVDILDFLDFIDDFSNCEVQPTPCGRRGNPDVNGDDFIDIVDFLDFVQAFSEGC